MNPLQRFRGTDAARLDLLAARATEAATKLARSRASIRAATGAGPDTPTDATLQSLQDWLNGVADDARRRAAATNGDGAVSGGTFPAGAGISGSIHPPVVTTTVTDPVLRDDGVTGLHLQGYLGVGLAWRHIGTETRTQTTSTDYGAGWVRTEVRPQHRAVYAVEIGAGYGPKRFGGLGEHVYHDGWHSGHARTSYAHDGQPVSANDFQAATA